MVPYARVIITTQAAAVGRSWGALVFMDSQEGVWPEVVKENPFLNDARREQFNRDRSRCHSRLLTSSDRLNFQDQRVLGLMENCSGSILFSGSLTDGRAPEVQTFPNEWAAQVLLSGQCNAAEALTGWKTTGQPNTNNSTGFTDGKGLSLDRQEFRQVHARRSDPEAMPGAHEFCFAAESDGFQVPYSASGLDGVLSAPASFALRALFQAVPRDETDFMRKEGLLLGVWTHATLAHLFNQNTNTAVEQILPIEGSVVSDEQGLWMRLLAEKAEWMVRTCLLEVQNLEGNWLVDQAEWDPENIFLSTPCGLLHLSGRMDLVLKSDRGEQLIIDFKTGRSGEIPTPRSLKNQPMGLQYVAYLLLTEGLHEHRAVRVINPFKTIDRELRPEHIEDAQQHLHALALMAQKNAFPRRGALRDEYGSSAEVLPLTSLPIDEAVLEEKWQSLITGGGTG